MVLANPQTSVLNSIVKERCPCPWTWGLNLIWLALLHSRALPSLVSTLHIISYSVVACKGGLQKNFWDDLFLFRSSHLPRFSWRILALLASSSPSPLVDGRPFFRCFLIRPIALRLAAILKSNAGHGRQCAKVELGRMSKNHWANALIWPVHLHSFLPWLLGCSIPIYADVLRNYNQLYQFSAES